MRAADLCNMDVVTYFVQGQGPVALCTIASVAIGHFFVQRWFDKKEGALANKEDTKESALDVDKALEGAGPAYYAILPMLPLGLLIGFSPLVYKAYQAESRYRDHRFFNYCFSRRYCNSPRFLNSAARILRQFLRVWARSLPLPSA
mgnify:CR=1 FL=1